MSSLIAGTMCGTLDDMEFEQKLLYFESHNPFVPMFPAYLQISPYLQTPDLQICISRSTDLYSYTASASRRDVAPAGHRWCLDGGRRSILAVACSPSSTVRSHFPWLLLPKARPEPVSLYDCVWSGD